MWCSTLNSGLTLPVSGRRSRPGHLREQHQKRLLQLALLGQSLPVAKIRVDTGVFHLDQLYDYIVPEKLSDSAVVGVRVQLPFGGRETEGIIASRVPHPDRAGELKVISKIPEKPFQRD